MARYEIYVPPVRDWPRRAVEGWHIMTRVTRVSKIIALYGELDDMRRNPPTTVR